MTFRQFKKWFRDPSNGCIWIMSNETWYKYDELIRYIGSLPFWKRRKAWKCIEIDIYENVVSPIDIQREINKAKENDDDFWTSL